ncbi:MAG: PilN domain-containing protein [Fibromonadaceae bacterium]|jgi:type IV pilus assembly protein PilN|nr:PilN domain-containing protein [Fibromonadaceae bacterium]
MANLQRNSSFIEINLLPSEYKRTKVDLSWLSDARVVWSTFALILVSVVMLAVYVYITDTIHELEKAVGQTKQAVEKERPLLEKIKELDEKLAVIKRKSDALRSIQVSRKRWVILFEDLSTALPHGTWITGITQSGDQMDINCSTWNFAEVALYMLRLEQKESVTGVSLTSISAVRMSDEEAYNFSLKVAFNSQLGMEDGAR